MIPTLLILMTPLALGIAIGVRSLLRERDLSAGALVLMLVLLALRHVVSDPAAAVAVPTLAGALEAQAAPLLVDLAVNLSALLVTIVGARVLHERNRAEHVQWTSMEGLRSLTEHLRESQPADAPDLGALLEHGCQGFDLEAGMLVSPAGSDCEAPTILALCAPTGTELALGPCPALRDTLVARALASDDVIAIERASNGHWSTHPEHAPFGWESFLGTRLASGEVLCFASRKEREERFGGAQKSLLLVMAEWLAPRLALQAASERVAEAEKALVPAAAVADTGPRAEPRPDAHTRGADAREARVGEPQRTQAGASTRGTGSRAGAGSRGAADAAARASEQRSLRVRAVPGLDLNEALRAREASLREGTGAELRLDLDPEAPEVDLGRAILDRLVRTLVLYASEVGALADGPGKHPAIELRTARVAPAGGGIEDLGFATLAVRSVGAALDGESVAALYEGREPWSQGAAHRSLPLARLVRALREAGGDLSIESQESIGTTLTAYLPAAALPSRSGADGHTRPFGSDAAGAAGADAARPISRHPDSARA